jgi:putative ABC transport system permease protein
MGIHLLRGRLFNASDYSGTTRAALINAAEANQLWPNQDPIGKHIEYLVDEPTPSVMDFNIAYIVVGVVSDTHHRSLDRTQAWRPICPWTRATRSRS